MYGGKMSGADLERLRRQKVLKDLNSRLTTGTKDGLSITGHKIPIQGAGVRSEAKPSRIPTPESTSRPLPPLGYVADGISLLPTQHPPNGETPVITSVQHPSITMSPAKPPKTITVEFRAITTNEKQPSKASCEEHSNLSAHSAAVKPKHSGRTEASYRKKQVSKPKATTGDKHIKITKQTRASGGHKTHSSRGGSGKLKELRIWYIARKYYWLWCRRVYGRVLPSAARLHRERSLKRRALGVWREQWWVARREWKLNIRAECHNRYRLWQKVWSVWTEFVQLSQCKRRKRELARNFAKGKLLRNAWRGWSRYILARRGKKEMKAQVEQWSIVRMKRTVWCKWKSAVEEKSQFASMNSLALHHWALQLQKKALYSWLQCYHERVLLRQRASVAVQHWRRNMIGQCLGAWLTYVQRRRVKHQMRGVASEHHNLVLTVKVFGCWKSRFIRARQLADFQELIAIRGQLATLKRAVWKWKFYITMKHYESDQKEVAAQCYSLTLKSKMLRILQTYATMQQRQATNNHLAQQFHIRKSIHHCWVVWLRRCEHCEEIKLGPKTRLARAHIANKLKGMAVAAWLEYTEYRRGRKQLRSRADQHFKAVALPNCFAAMKMFVAIQRHHKQLKELSTSYRRETLLSMAFYKWWREAQLSQDVRLLERVAILHNEEVMKKKLMKLWKSRTRERVRQHGKEERAIAHRYYTITTFAFQKWKQRYQNSVRSVQQVKLAIQHNDRRLMGLVWTTWAKYVAKKRLSHLKRWHAIKHSHKILQRKALEAWKNFHSCASVKKAKKLKAVEIYQGQLKRKAFIGWCEGIQVCKDRRRLLCQATDFHKLSALKKYFGKWWEKTANAIEQNQKENEMLKEANTQLERLKLVRIISSWRKYVSLSVVQRTSEEKARLHHSKVVQAKCFVSWYDYHRLQLRKGLLQRQGAWFEHNRLLSLTYSKWRVQLMHTLVMKRKASLALWHWSQSLERRVLAAWLLYAMQKRRKKERYNQAMERHRKRLITTGVRQWIKVASQIQMQREETALQQQLATTQTAMSCARKYALHWRRVVRERRLRAHAHSIPAASASIDPLQQQHHPATKPSPVQPSSDLWNNLARQLKIPDGVCLSRPQPRRSTLLSHSHFPSDAVPRVPAHPPPSTLPLPGDRATAARENDSFMFHASSCSEAELLGDRSITQLQAQGECSDHQTITSVAQRHNTAAIAAGDGQIIHRSQELHQPHDYPFPLPGSFFEGPNADTKEHAGCCSASARGQGPSQERKTIDLTSHSIQMEIIQMRDELKRFHDLKLHHRELEAQLVARMSQGGSETTELEERIKESTEQIKQFAPVVHVIATKIKQLVP